MSIWEQCTVAQAGTRFIVGTATIWHEPMLTRATVTFSSAIVMLASLKSSVLNMQATDSSFQLHWTRSLAILEYYKEHVCSATQVIRSLQAVQQRMFKQQQKRAGTVIYITQQAMFF